VAILIPSAKELSYFHLIRFADEVLSSRAKASTTPPGAPPLHLSSGTGVPPVAHAQDARATSCGRVR